MDNKLIGNKNSESKQIRRPHHFIQIAVFLVVLATTICSVNILITYAEKGFYTFSNGLATATAASTTDEKSVSPLEPTAILPSASSSNKDTSLGNIASLDGTCLYWGQGLRVDDQNRPVDCLTAQELYGKYDADFIKDSSKKYIYLTYDEGFENGYTSKTLDILKEKNVSAVFFVTGLYAKKHNDLIQRMIDEGHVVGNHSAMHPKSGLPSLSIAAQQKEIMQCHNYIKSTFGYTMYLFRFPAGKYSERSLSIVKSCNYHSVFWSFAYRDFDVNHQMADGQALNKMTKSLHSGAIYLLHCVSKTNLNILADFIDYARAQGYEFMVYSE